MSTRRHFIKTVSMAGAAALMFRGKAWSYGSSPTNLRKFIQRLPGLGPAGANELGNYIPVATPNTQAIHGVDYYQMEIRQFSQQMHPDLPNPTKLWGYVDATTGKAGYLGPAIVAKRNTPVQLTFTNKLPDSHILPVDTTLPGAEPDQPVNRAAVHLHGGFVPWVSDGGPMSWFDPTGRTGSCFMNNKVLRPNAKPGQAEYYYPNQQSARLMWYHDHAMGITRLNAYAGIAAPYIITDDFESKLQAMGLLPADQIPLVLQDKAFFDGGITDPAYPVSSAVTGDLWYPWDYEADIWDIQGGTPPPLSCVPEAFFDTAVINGAVFPYVDVERKMYRFRILNGSQARFYNLQLYYATPSDAAVADITKPGPAMLQLGTEGGFLPAPVMLDKNTQFAAQFDKDGNLVPGTSRYNLLLAPAERADIIVDFSQCPTGSTLILYNDAPAPFPGGEPPQDADDTSPNTATLLQFRVHSAKTRDRLSFQQVFHGLTSELRCAAPQPLLPGRIRKLTLNEGFDERGRLLQRLGTTKQEDGDFGRNYMDEPTEVVHEGHTEIWRIYNLTMDTHPIHFHLVNVQVLGRAQFDWQTPRFQAIGKWTQPDANERGWKETVRMNPGEVTDVIANFSLPKVPFKVPVSEMFGGHEYVWHCHILEHEEHDMMRPLIVK